MASSSTRWRRIMDRHGSVTSKGLSPEDHLIAHLQRFPGWRDVAVVLDEQHGYGDADGCWWYSLVGYDEHDQRIRIECVRRPDEDACRLTSFSVTAEQAL
jgi:hypothetical protein